MEPAPEERDDCSDVKLIACLVDVAAMEPAPEERDDARGLGSDGAHDLAAMEPAPEERDD